MKRKAKNLIKHCLRSCGYRVERLESQDFLDPLISRRIRQREQFRVVQVGANDGVSFDTLHTFVTENSDKVRGLMLEPLKDVFEVLKRNYRNYPNIIPVNAAIHNTQKEMTIYRVDPEKQGELPDWARGIASFQRDFHQDSDQLSKYMIEEKVSCVTLSDLLHQYNFSGLDLLQIDTEGYDCEIIRGIDFQSVKPDVIYFEHGRRFGATTKQQLRDVLDLLRSNGYYFMIEPDDIVAYQHDLERF